MKIFILIISPLLLTFGITISRANLNDTEAQFITKYGQESDVRVNLGFDVVGDKAASFTWKTSKFSLLINVTFLNGVAALEKITPADASHDISEDQKKAILASESAGLQWSEQATNYHTDRSDVTSVKQIWLRSDGTTAICWMSGKLTTTHGWGEIDLSTKEYAAAQRELDRQNGAR